MASLDEIFYKEFTQMMHQLKGYNGNINIYDVPLPPEAADKFFIETREKVTFANITEEWYSKLNGTEALIWGAKALKRRKYDYKGDYIMKDGHYVVEDVTLPHECIAIISPISIGVPAKFKSKEQFQYVDMVSKDDGKGGKIHRFVYIVPRKYCYKLNQTALVLSWNKMRTFYSGVGLSLQNGSVLFMYTIPYKPTQQAKPYRVLQCKTSDDYTEEFTMLRDFWISTKYIFNPAECELMDMVRGRQNMAIEQFNGTLDIYERFDSSRSMGEEETIEEVDFI